MLYPNKTVSIYRGNSYGTTVITGLKLYIYERSDDLSMVNDIDGGNDEVKALTKYNGIIVGDKIVDNDNIVYIVKKVIPRVSVVVKSYELVLRKKYD